MATVSHPAVDTKGRAAGLLSTVGLARIALGVAALHVVDDNFLQPQPGTSAAEHLPGGLVQVGALALLAWSFPRLRPGAQGALAIFAGLLTIVMGAGEAGYYARESGPTGDDFTGLLAIPAGVLLVGVGVAALWRSRKGGGVARRYARRAGLAVASAVAIVFVLFPLAQGYVVTHAGRAVVPEPTLGRPFEEVTFASSDGLRLEGWFVPSRNGATVISFPGRRGPQKPARVLAEHGYGVLLFDRRGEGESEGDPNALGWRGTKDLEGATAYLRSRDDVDPERIGGLGLSVGGEMMLQFAAETDDLRAILSEGAGVRSVREAVHMDGIEKIGGTVLFGVMTVGTAVFASDLPPPSLLELSGEVDEPVLVIHATPGAGGETLSERYYEEARGPKEYWAAPGGHTGAIDAAPAEYERRVVGFFDRNLLGR